MKVSKATWDQHKEICALAKLSPYSKGFREVRFVQEYYKKEWVLVTKERGKITGFICVRHLVRKPYTSVYYMGVLYKRAGIGTALIKAAAASSPHSVLKLISEKDNVEGLAFYKTLGFLVEGEGTNKQGEPFWRLERTL